MLTYLLVSAFVIVLSVVIWRRKNLPPGPWGVPIIGYLPFLDPKAPHITLTDLSKKYGPTYGLSLGNVYTVVLTDSKTIKKVFAKDSTTGRAPLYLTHGIMKGYGLICAEGELWKDQRRFVFNCLRQFGGSKIGQQRQKMESLIMDHVLDFVNFVKNQGERVTLDPLESLRHSLGSAINIIVFGKSWSREDEIWKWLQHLQEEGTRHIGVAGPLNFLPFLRFLPKFKQTMTFLIDGKIETHKIYQNIIDEQFETLTKEDSSEDANNVIQAFLMEREKRKNSQDVDRFYNDQQFYHLLADVFGAGLDTTLTTLRWYLLYVSTHKNIQTKIHEELKLVLKDRNPTLEDLPSLPLVEASIAEAQRIRSVVPMGIPHGSVEELQIDGYNIPKGTMIVPLQWAIHMEENLWKDPEEFNPWRFINEEGKFYKPEGFIPFQTGKRMCVGDELARMLLFLFGATILQNFTVNFDDSMEPDFVGECGITLTPKPHKLTFCKN